MYTGRRIGWPPNEADGLVRRIIAIQQMVFAAISEPIKFLDNVVLISYHLRQHYPV
jgi:hypothetical protein